VISTDESRIHLTTLHRSLESDSVMARMLTREQVIKELRRKQGERTNRDFAAELGIHESHIGQIYKGTRDPGESILSQLNLTKRVVYEKTA
jgi:predicted transcriptional regulator